MCDPKNPFLVLMEEACGLSTSGLSRIHRSTSPQTRVFLLGQGLKLSWVHSTYIVLGTFRHKDIYYLFEVLLIEIPLCRMDYFGHKSLFATYTRPMVLLAKLQWGVVPQHKNCTQTIFRPKRVFSPEVTYWGFRAEWLHHSHASQISQPWPFPVRKLVYIYIFKIN